MAVILHESSIIESAYMPKATVHLLLGGVLSMSNGLKPTSFDSHQTGFQTKTMLLFIHQPETD